MRLSVHRTPRHIYAQVFDPESHVVAVASTLQDDVAQGLKGTGNVEAAKAVGKAIAERAKAKGITQVAFDRSGFRYHGRVKALADAARGAPGAFAPGEGRGVDREAHADRRRVDLDARQRLRPRRVEPSTTRHCRRRCEKASGDRMTSATTQRQ